MKPAIVIMAYNRPGSLKRLLRSITQAHYPSGESIPLIISIDKSNSSEVHAIAQSFEWTFGEKEVILHEKRLGLMEHFLFCCSFSKCFESIIFLEDDFYVSPAFYAYSMQALDFYGEAEEIALLPLYALQLNGFIHQAFNPILDKADVFFGQVGWFKGMAVTAKQWEAFAVWHSARQEKEDPRIPEAWQKLGDEEWFPLFSSYLVDTLRYFVFPRSSLVTDFSDAGMHFGQDTNLYQANLMLETRDFEFLALEQSIAVYDAFLELLPSRINHLSTELIDYQYSVDLNASKMRQQIGTDYALTTRPTRHAIREFSTRMLPLEVNVLHKIAGRGIALSKTSDLRWDRRAEWGIRLRRYKNNPNHGISLRRSILFWLLAKLEKLGLLE